MQGKPAIAWRAFLFVQGSSADNLLTHTLAIPSFRQFPWATLRGPNPQRDQRKGLLAVPGRNHRLTGQLELQNLAQRFNSAPRL